MSSGENHMEWQRQTLIWAVQALALDATAQLALYPDFVVKADELALDFHDALTWTRDGMSTGWTAEQAAALVRLDEKLSRLSRGGPEYDESPWFSGAALSTDSRWENVRALARDTLRAFHRPLENPPADPEQRGATSIG